MTKTQKSKTIIVKPPKLFSYQMPKEMAKTILNDYEKGKVDEDKILVDWVNKNCGLLYPCNKVVVN